MAMEPMYWLYRLKPSTPFCPITRLFIFPYWQSRSTATVKSLIVLSTTMLYTIAYTMVDMSFEDHLANLMQLGLGCIDLG